MSAFPDTPATLLAKIAVQVTGQTNELAWVRFFELYEPAIRKFAECQGAKTEAEDIAQEILMKLVDILRAGKYSTTAGKFRCYLATLIRREVINHWRKGQSRAVDEHISLDNPDAGLDIACDFDAGDELDLKWKLARHEAAVEHTLTKTALSKQSKDVYRAYVIDQMPLKEVEKRFNLTDDVIYKVKSRVEKMIAALEADLAD